MTEESKLVLPGELLGTAEEFVPGHGTYEYNGQVFAALLGQKRVDSKSRTVTVEALHAVPQLVDGEVVYARVEEIKSSMLVTNVLRSAANKRIVPGTPEGTVHISKAKESYVDELGREFSVGDIIKAQVLQGYPVVKLTTQGEAMGVVAARCGDCRSPLVRKGDELHCPRCGRIEHRKLSSEYGAIRLASPGEPSLDGAPAEPAQG